MKRKPRNRTKCGACVDGVLVGVNMNEIQACDECRIYLTDESATDAVRTVYRALFANQYGTKRPRAGKAKS